MIQSTLNNALGVLILCSAPYAWAESVTGVVDFNTPADLAKFNLAENGQVPDYFAAGGVSDSGSIGLTYEYNAAGTLVYNERSFGMSDPTDALTLSIMFRYQSSHDISGDVVALNLFAEPTPANRFSTGFAVSYFEAQSSSGEPAIRLIDVTSYVNGGGRGQGFPVDPLVDGNWYRLAATYSFAGDSLRNHVDVSLEDFGTAGAALLDVTFQQSYTADPQLDVFQDVEVWAGFSTMLYVGSGTDRADNFAYQVPEPASCSLLAVALVCLAPRMRAKTRSRAMHCRQVAPPSAAR